MLRANSLMSIIKWTFFSGLTYRYSLVLEKVTANCLCIIFFVGRGWRLNRDAASALSFSSFSPIFEYFFPKYEKMNTIWC